MSNIDADVNDGGEQKITMDDYRAAMDRAAKAEKAADQANRLSAMTIAGIPTGTKVGQAFVRDFDGDISDPDKVRAAAVEWGLWKPEGSDAAPAGTPATPADQAQVDADRAALQQGGHAPDGSEPPPEHPGQVGLREFYKAKAEGGTSEASAANVINRIVDAAAKGDSRVLIPNQRQT